MRGRKRIPSKIIELRGGTAHTHRPPRDDEPKPPEEMPPCPEHLDEDARREWERAGKILESIGLMTGLDMAVLAGYCQSWSEYVKATVEVQKRGTVLRRRDGSPMLNPYLRVAREAYERWMKAGALLGFNPTSRAALKVERPKPIGKLQRFMGRKN